MFKHKALKHMYQNVPQLFKCGIVVAGSLGLR